MIVCRKEIDAYIGSCEAAQLPIAFKNLDTLPLSLEEFGLSAEIARKQHYVQTAGGDVVSGVDAFISIWQALPGYRWLAKIVNFPLAYPIFSAVYDMLAAPAVSYWSRFLRRKTHSTPLATNQPR